MKAQLVPHRTRVAVEGRGFGMVIRVDNARRLLLFGRSRREIPARVHVILDGGSLIVVSTDEVTVA